MIRRRPARARPAAIPAPVRGLNSRDALASMDPADAVILDNWFPDGDVVRLRRGFVEHATGVGASVESLLEYNGPGTRKLFAAGGGSIFDVSSAGAVGSAEVSSLTGNRWQTVMFTTPGGTFMVAANGADAVRNYDGSSWTTPSITGVTSADLINVTVHKRRLWFVEKDSSTAWFLPVNSIAGAASSLELGAVWRNGGRLAHVIPLSADAGDGPDDYAAFLSDKGEVALYEGTDPASPGAFNLVGVYRVGAPIGDRSAIRVGGDAAVITEEGVVSLMRAMQVDPSAIEQATITDRIRTLFADTVRTNRSRFGWQGIAYPAGNYALFNAPTGGATSVQYVMNTITGAWCRFTGMNAQCWGLLNGALYFGTTTGTVCKADTGTDDDGADIRGELKTAFNYFRDRGGLKRFTMLRPSIASNGAPTPVLGLNIDFSDALPTGTPSFSVSGALWDVAQWDAAQWAGDAELTQNWISVFGLGRCASVRMRTATQGLTMELSAFDVLYEPAMGAAL